jgi:hypothetical protein
LTNTANLGEYIRILVFTYGGIMIFARKEWQERTEERRTLSVTVEYSLPTNDPDKDCSKGVGQTTNISPKGLNLLMNCPVNEGMCMALYSNILSEGLITGQVRWCTSAGKNLYRIGLRLN